MNSTAIEVAIARAYETFDSAQLPLHPHTGSPQLLERVLEEPGALPPLKKQDLRN